MVSGIVCEAAAVVQPSLRERNVRCAARQANIGTHKRVTFRAAQARSRVLGSQAGRWRGHLVSARATPVVIAFSGLGRDLWATWAE